MTSAKISLCLLILLFSMQAEEIAPNLQTDLNTDENTVRVPHKGMIITGSCLFGTSYVLALITTIGSGASNFESDKKVAKVMWIPFAGPIISDAVDGIDDIALITVGNYLWSFAEIAGALLITGGIIGKKQVLQQSKRKFKMYPKLVQGKYPGIEMSVSFP